MTIRNNPRKGIREETSQSPTYIFPRPPTVNDKRDRLTNKPYEVGSRLVIGHSPRTGIPVASGTAGELWYLSKYDTNGDAIWLPLTSGTSPAALKFRDQVNAEVVPTGTGLTDWDGVTVANAANPSAIPVETVKSGANTMLTQVQVGTAITGAPADKNNAGLVSFDDTAFDVTTHGYVTMKGGAGPAIDTIKVDNATGPGVDPVTADGTGKVTVGGDVVAAHSVPVDIHTRALNAYKVEVQVAATNTGSPASKVKTGLSQYNDTQFVVDSDGYVSMVGGTDLPAIQQIETDTGSGSEATPDANGEVKILGGTGIDVTNSGGTITVASNVGDASFLAYLSSNSSNATGDGTVVHIVGDSENYDTGSDYNTGTGFFVVPTTGVYYLAASIGVGALAAGHTTIRSQIIVRDSGDTTDVQVHELSQGSPGTMQSAANEFVSSGSVSASLTSGQLVKMVVVVSGSTKTVSILGGTMTSTPRSTFSGFLVR